jgi:hypothetical protein
MYRTHVRSLHKRLPKPRNRIPTSRKFSSRLQRKSLCIHWTDKFLRAESINWCDSCGQRAMSAVIQSDEMRSPRSDRMNQRYGHSPFPTQHPRVGLPLGGVNPACGSRLPTHRPTSRHHPRPQPPFGKPSQLTFKIRDHTPVVRGLNPPVRATSEVNCRGHTLTRASVEQLLKSSPDIQAEHANQGRGCKGSLFSLDACRGGLARSPTGPRTECTRSACRADTSAITCMRRLGRTSIYRRMHVAIVCYSD